MLNSRKLKVYQCEKNGYCHTRGCRCVKNHSSKTYLKPGPNHNKDSTQVDTKGGSTKTRTRHAPVMRERVSGHYMTII